MSEEKFIKDVKILLDFVEIYCKDKHDDVKNTKELTLEYKGESFESISYTLCKKCEEDFLYSYARLQECPHDEKPRCRRCKKPCYEKPQWKSLKNIMKYSGMKKGLIKVKKLFTKRVVAE